MSKLGWQFQSIPDWAGSVVNSPWVKLIDPPLTQAFPGARVIGRVYIPDDTTNAMIWRGAIGAAEWWDHVAPIMLARPWVWCWELPNEPQPVASWEYCLALADFTSTAGDLMHAASIRSVGGNLAEGNPGGDTENERANLFCAIARGLTHCDYWSQHAYWVPDGYAHREAGYNQWHALRYQLNRQYARERGISLPPVLLTEGGWDFGIVGRPKQGWRCCASWETYLRDLVRFDADLMADPGVLGCQLFVTGANADWQSFEIGEAESRSLAAYNNLVIPPPVEPPPVVVTPQPAPGLSIGRPLPRGKGRVSQVFGTNYEDYSVYGYAGHEGLDYGCPVGTPVLACSAGRVTWAGERKNYAAYGKHVVVTHGEYESWYCHLSAVDVAVGDMLTQGQRLGASGNTGRSTGPHLHFAIKVPAA